MQKWEHHDINTDTELCPNSKRSSEVYSFELILNLSHKTILKVLVNEVVSMLLALTGAML